MVQPCCILHVVCWEEGGGGGVQMLFKEQNITTAFATLVLTSLMTLYVIYVQTVSLNSTVLSPAFTFINLVLDVLVISSTLPAVLANSSITSCWSSMECHNKARFPRSQSPEETNA